MRRASPKTSALSSSVNNTTTDIPVVTGTGLYFQKGDLVLNPSTAEVMKVASATADVVVVVRGIAGTTGATSTSTNDSLFVIGSAFSEGQDVSTPDEWQSVQVSNFTQIFRRPFGATRTREGSESYFGGNRETQRAEKAIEHAIDIERAMLFGTGRKTLPRRKVPSGPVPRSVPPVDSSTSLRDSVTARCRSRMLVER